MVTKPLAAVTAPGAMVGKRFSVRAAGDIADTPGADPVQTPALAVRAFMIALQDGRVALEVVDATTGRTTTLGVPAALKAAHAQTVALPVGTRIVSIKGDHDSDGDDRPRHTGPNAEGVIDAVLLQDDGTPYYSVVFEPSKVWVFLYEEEVQNPDLYRIVSRPDGPATFSR